MSKKREQRDAQHFGEPWEAERDSPPQTIDGEDAVPESRLPWRVWAHVAPQIAGETTVFGSPGEVVECTDRWPIITFRFSHVYGVPGVNHETLAKRVVQCINFCRGVDLDDAGFDSLKKLIESRNTHASIMRQEINDLWPLSTEKKPDPAPSSPPRKTRCRGDRSKSGDRATQTAQSEPASSTPAAERSTSTRGKPARSR